MKWMGKPVFWILLLLLPAQAIEIKIEPEEIEEFRVSQSRNVIISFFETLDEPEQLADFSADCLNRKTCHVTSIAKLSEHNSTATAVYNVTIEALFLGITELKVSFGNASLPSPYEIRVMRANWYVKMAHIFAITAGIFVCFVTFLMGTQLEWRRIKAVMKQPIGPLIGFFAQFFLMPLTGYFLATYGLNDNEMVLRLALFAASTCPGGGKSSFWTIIFGGNLDLSVTMTFSQTIAALVMMPLWISTLGKQFTTKRVDIPFLAIIEGLVALLVPASLGMYFIATRQHLVKKIERYIKIISWIATGFFTAFALYANWYILLLLNWRIFFVGCALPWSGYIIAYITATFFRQEWKDKITISIETGVQNVGIATILMMWSLPEPEVDISLTILFAIMLCTDKPLCILWVVLYCWRKLKGEKGSNEEKYKVNSNGIVGLWNNIDFGIFGNYYKPYGKCPQRRCDLTDS